MADVVVLVPALGRPGRVSSLQSSLYGSRDTIDFRLVYLVSPNDALMLEVLRSCAVEHMVTPFPNAPGDYARKLNYGIGRTTEEWIFLGADDLKFWPGWAEVAISASRQNDNRMVVGTNDLGNAEVKRGKHSTHSFVHRDYVEQGTWDEPDKLLHEGYHHNWVDKEFVQTAIRRDQYIHSASSIVEHLHPHWGKSEMDATYRKGLADYERDRRLYVRREKSWKLTPLSGVSRAGQDRQ